MTRCTCCEQNRHAKASSSSSDGSGMVGCRKSGGESGQCVDIDLWQTARTRMRRRCPVQAPPCSLSPHAITFLLSQALRSGLRRRSGAETRPALAWEPRHGESARPRRRGAEAQGPGRCGEPPRRRRRLGRDLRETGDATRHSVLERCAAAAAALACGSGSGRSSELERRAVGAPAPAPKKAPRRREGEPPRCRNGNGEPRMTASVFLSRVLGPHPPPRVRYSRGHSCTYLQHRRPESEIFETTLVWPFKMFGYEVVLGSWSLRCDHHHQP